jgi:hypothetical protein
MVAVNTVRPPSQQQQSLMAQHARFQNQPQTTVVQSPMMAQQGPGQHANNQRPPQPTPATQPHQRPAQSDVIPPAIKSVMENLEAHVASKKGKVASVAV